MADTKKLEDVINAVLDGNDEHAATAFHDYLGDKTREFIRNRTEKSDDVADLT